MNIRDGRFFDRRPAGFPARHGARADVIRKIPRLLRHGFVYAYGCRRGTPRIWRVRQTVSIFFSWHRSVDWPRVGVYIYTTSRCLDRYIYNCSRQISFYIYLYCIPRPSFDAPKRGFPTVLTNYYSRERNYYII